MQPELTVALVSIARPTFDVELAQQVAGAVLARLEEAGCRCVGSGARLVMDDAGVDQAMAALAGETYDLLILLQASFADSSMAVRIVRAAQADGMPVLLWAVPDARDGGRLRLNSLCGINLAGHALTRQGIIYGYLHAPATDPDALSEVKRWARAGRARRLLGRSRIGLIGRRPAGFDTCEFDAGDLNRLFGTFVLAFPLEETIARASRVDQATREAFVTRAGRHAANLGDLDQAAVQGTAGVYAALRDLATEQELSGLAVRCWPEFFTELGCAACGAMSMLNEEMCPASCEADVNGTLTSLLLQALSGSQAFITDLVSMDDKSDTGVLWHCGLAPVSMADPQEPVLGTVHSNRRLPLLFEFPLKPGRITIARLHRTAPADRAGYRLVMGGGEMVRAPKSFGGTSGVVRFDRPAAAVLDTILSLGLEHHFSITYGDVRGELRAFARLVGLEVVELC